MNWLELRIPPVFVVLICALAMRVVARWEQALMFSASTEVAIAVDIGAVIIVALGVVEFGRAKTTVDPTAPEKATHIVDRGVFAISRNPMYVKTTWVIAIPNTPFTTRVWRVVDLGDFGRHPERATWPPFA